MIGVVDYGRGNLHSVLKALGHVGATAGVVESPERLWDCAAAVVPGVGAFGDAMERLCSTGMDAALREFARDGRPMLGICLGMQVMLSSGSEGGAVDGLGLIEGTVRRLRTGPSVKIPHTGWNEVRFQASSDLTRGIPDGSHFYFVHSYAAFPEHGPNSLATTTHGVTFSSIVGRDNVLGVQFHPEKSGRVGLRLLANFVSMAERSCPC